MKEGQPGPTFRARLAGDHFGWREASRSERKRLDSSADNSESPSIEWESREAAYQQVLGRGSISWVSSRPFIRVLGAGGQGTVMLAERRGAGQFCLPVALKFFSPKHFGSAKLYDDEMLRQAEVASRVAQIQDDHLVDVHSFIHDSGIYYTEMEWIDGFDLLHILRRDVLDLIQDAVTAGRWESINNRIVTTGEVDCRLKPGMAMAIIRECLAGVSALHRDGIIHCDLKPSNVMVKRTGQVKIVDTGSAFWIGCPPDGQPCSPEYAAPEVLKGYRATTQSDLASLGYMLIEMLTGARPFAGLKFAQLLDAKQALPARLASLLPQDEFAFIEPLTRFLQRLIDPDPSRRFATAGEAELSSEGAAGFLNELVKIDRSEEYASELRIWIAEMESNPVFDPAGRTCDLIIARGPASARVRLLDWADRLPVLAICKYGPASPISS
jgi:serine/threonine protein kinase